tara:strand:- start:237 stop:389 length:153 start_codon:yes stop_codon:yes gene_type:complete
LDKFNFGLSFLANRCKAQVDDGDLLVIDRSLETIDNKITVCFVDGEFTAI